MGAVCYLDAWDVRRGKAFGRSEPKGGIEPFDRLVWQVMTKEPYASARRVFWVVDNGSDHRGQRSIDRLQGSLAKPDPRPPARPRQLAQPSRDLPLDHPAQSARPQRLPEHRRGRPRAQRLRTPLHEIAQPFAWNFTRQDLTQLIDRLADHDRTPQLSLAA